ncbi:hypothetical protein, partial [Amycolatopsis vancoresmycina]
MSGHLDRYGEHQDDDVDTTQAAHHECNDGWLDADGAVPCLTCRPHLAPPARTPRPAPEVAEAG